MEEWKDIKLSDFVNINPKEVLKKGVMAKKVSMDKLKSFCRDIPEYLIEEYISLDKINELGLFKINPLEVCLVPELLGELNINNIKKYLDSNDIKKANISFLKKD